MLEYAEDGREADPDDLTEGGGVYVAVSARTGEILGVAGIIQPGTSALMHNASTIAIGLHSMTGLLPGEAENL